MKAKEDRLIRPWVVDDNRGCGDDGDAEYDDDGGGGDDDGGGGGVGDDDGDVNESVIQDSISRIGLLFLFSKYKWFWR